MVSEAIRYTYRGRKESKRGESERGEREREKERGSEREGERDSGKLRVSIVIISWSCSALHSASGRTLAGCSGDSTHYESLHLKQWSVPLHQCSLFRSDNLMHNIVYMYNMVGQNLTKSTNVQFGYAFYILLVGGLFSLGAAASNLLFARSAADRRRSLRLRFRYNIHYITMCICSCVSM